MLKISKLHTRGVSCPKKSSTGTSLSCLVSEKRSIGEPSVSKEWESLDSVGRLTLSAWGVEGVLIDFIPLDLSLGLPVPLSRFW